MTTATKQARTKLSCASVPLNETQFVQIIHDSGQMLAALLKWPQATFASKVEIDQATNKARVTREVG